MGKLQDLETKYNNIFIGKNHGYDHFGFECGEGWADLLEPVFNYINDYNTKNSDSPIQINQIKEKWGTLRFYCSGYTNELDELICQAEAESASVCEQCGKPGTTGGKRWFKTACEEHKDNK